MAASSASSNPFEAEPEETLQLSSTRDSQWSKLSADNDDDNDTSADALWQYLKDLPYRRVPIYSNVHWEVPSDGEEWHSMGLSCYPSRSNETFWEQSTVTRLVGCPTVGGPLCRVTHPLVPSKHFPQTLLLVSNNAGTLLTSIPFPPSIEPGDELSLLANSKYTAASILTLGFTSSQLLVVVLQDSLCLVYNIRGQLVLDPFFALSTSTPLSTAVVHATGCCCLAQDSQDCVLVELIDISESQEGAGSTGATDPSELETPVPPTALVIPPFQDFSIQAILTPLATADYSRRNNLQFLACAVLPRTCTAHGYCQVYLSTMDSSVVTVPCGPYQEDPVDLNCRQQFQGHAISHLRFAPNGRFLACFTTEGLLTVVSSNLDTHVVDFDTTTNNSRTTQPLQDMCWCGEDSVLMQWKSLGILMVGPFADWLRFPVPNTNSLSTQCHLIPQVDGCRIVTASTVEWLQRVPPICVDVLRMGSIQPAALLLDATQTFYAANSDNMNAAPSQSALRQLAEPHLLRKAIHSCLQVALQEWDIVMQKKLLRAASFGLLQLQQQRSKESFLRVGGPVHYDDDDDDEFEDDEEQEEKQHYQDSNEQILPNRLTRKFVQTAQSLRILNALRSPSVGFVVSWSQCQEAGWVGIVARLVDAGSYELARHISEFLPLPLRVQWYCRAAQASHYIASNRNSALSDAELAHAARLIIAGKHLKEDNSGSQDLSSSQTEKIAPAETIQFRGAYAMVAQAAAKAGKPGVANLLLLLETSVADKVPALIASGNYSDAVAVSTASADSDFILNTILEYEKSVLMSASGDYANAQATFFSTVVTKFTPEAFYTLRKYLSIVSDSQRSVSLDLRGQMFQLAGTDMALSAMRESDPHEIVGKLTEASRIFGLGNYAFHKTCTDDYLALRKDQDTLRKKYSSDTIIPEKASSSVTLTIAAVIEFAAINQREQHRLFVDADKIAKKFRVPEKRIWHIKVKAFADSGQWSNLRLLAEARKPPIGFKPFARAAIDGGQSSTEILQYIEGITDAEEKYDTLCYGEFWSKALDEGFKLRDARKILNVKHLCNSSEIHFRADELLESLA